MKPDKERDVLFINTNNQRLDDDYEETIENIIINDVNEDAKCYNDFYDECYKRDNNGEWFYPDEDDELIDDKN